MASIADDELKKLQTKAEENKGELLKSFHEQFAQNQNHHQTVFIQFISAVIVVIVGYALVFANTSSDAKIFDVTRDVNLKVTSYAIIHLFGSFFAAEFILTLLCIVLLNIGYGYRRDQNVIDKIRIFYMGENEHKIIFGVNERKPFKATDKNFCNYLPDFNFIFITFIFTLQLLLITSLFYAINHFVNFNLSLADNWFLHGLLVVLIILPIIISGYSFGHYYRKYKKNVN